MPEIAPSILSADFSNLRDEIKKVVAARYLHLDVMDGIFVPNLTFGPGLIKAIRPYTEQVFDTHLMMVKPERYIEVFANAGSDIITVHAEAVVHLDRVVEQIKDAGCQACVALNPATPLNMLDYVLDKLDMVLLMTVNPGFGGQTFIPGMYNKIQTLRKVIDDRKLDVLIEIDGGVNLTNVKKLAEVGVDIIVAGSAIFKADDPAWMLAEMKKEIAD